MARRSPSANAKRQREYRRRHLHDQTSNAERLSVILPSAAKQALARLSQRYGVTQREMLGRVLTEHEQRAMAEQAEVPVPAAEAHSLADRARVESLERSVARALDALGQISKIGSPFRAARIATVAWCAIQTELRDDAGELDAGPYDNPKVQGS